MAAGMAVATAHMGMMIFTTAPVAMSLTATTGLSVSNSAGRRSAKPGKNISSRLQPDRTFIGLTGPSLRAFPLRTVPPKGRSFPAIGRVLRVNMPAPPESTGHAPRVNMPVLPKNIGRVLLASMPVRPESIGNVPLCRRNSAPGLVLKRVKSDAVNRTDVPVRTGKVRKTGQGSVPAAEPDSIFLIIPVRLGKYPPVSV